MGNRGVAVDNELIQLGDLWKMLGGADLAKANNVLTLICGIMNIQAPDLIKPSSHDGDESKLRVVFDKKRNLFFRSFRDIELTHKRFLSLCYNRKTQLPASKKMLEKNGASNISMG